MNVLCVLCGGGYSCISLCNPTIKFEFWTLNDETQQEVSRRHFSYQEKNHHSDDFLYCPMYIYIYIWKASLCLCWTKMCCICAAADLCFTSAEWSGYSFLLSTSSRGWFDFPGMKHLIERNKIEVNLTIKQHGQAATAVSDCNNDWDQHLKNKDWN